MSRRTVGDRRLVTHGLHEGEFDVLTEIQKRRLVRLLARVAETSYRRGFQQGHQVASGGRSLAIDPYTLRFARSLDKSPCPDTGSPTFSALDRLFLECRELEEIGLSRPGGAG